MINEGVLVVVLFFVLALLRVPVFIALGLPASVYMLVFFGSPMEFPVNRMVRTVDSFTLLAVPIFIYVGALMNHGEVTDKIFDFADDIVGHLTGGLAQVNILTSLIFSGISGSALADIGGVGKVLIHTMTDRGYDNSFSAALTSASATIGPLFPPSIPLILYGILAEESILDLLIAGALPAIATVIFLMVGTFIIAYRNDFPANDHRAPLKSIGRSFIVALPALVTPVVLIVGMLSGYFGPTEAAAVTVIYILFINLTVYRITNLRYIWDAAVETAKTTSVILVILGAAGLFAYVLSVERIDQQFAEFLFSISETPAIVLFMVILLVLALGLVLDPLAALVMITPIVVPPLTSVGYDPIHMGVVVVYGLMIGLLTPPLGLSVYLSADIAGADPIEVFRSSVPFYGMLLAGLFVIAYIPEISLYMLRFT
ncbi:TRAP transporter large permease [Natronosalvus rutilus]|uniref:TRAP transporter large permease n=1 Tax=Natronosalvus rutilus TaxID=2953753 RepID=A0A9E7SX34_9EURY|nr:TRAP transporter large permease [Natronosalvus rutilus]UTF55767.1 TRAP transporter large permease [Natronosalvus rutilus]